MANQDDDFSFYKSVLGRTYVTASATAAAGVATATLPAVAGKLLFILGFNISGLGATVGLGVAPTVTGIISGTQTYAYAGVTGATLPNNTLAVSFGAQGIPASGANTAIVVSCPSLGAGNTANSVNVWGYYL